MPILLTDWVQLFFDSRVSWASKLLFVALVALYILLPIDLIPDFLLPFGVVDDAGMLLAAMSAFTRHARKQVEGDTQAPASDSDMVIALADDQAQAGASDEIAIAPPENIGAAPAQPVVYIQREARGSRSNYGCLALLLILILSPFVGIAILLFSGSMALSGIIAPIVDFLNPQASVNFVSSRTIVDSVRGLSQLVTVRAEFVKTDLEVIVHEGILNSGYHRANHLVVGSVRAGVDLTQLERGDISYQTDGSLHLVLPAPILTNCDIEHIDQDEYSISVLQKDWDAIRQMAEYEAIRQFRQDALEGRLLEEAKDEITYRLGEFVRLLTGSPVFIASKDSSTDSKFDSTCYPELPKGWQIEAETGEWTRKS